MPRTFQTTYSEGIHHGLPTFPAHDGKKYTAIVSGSNGISGSEIVKVLAETPERWETIYSMSRKPPTSSKPQVKPISADFLNSTPEELAAHFKNEGVKADFIFFASYLQPPAPDGAQMWSNTDDLDRVNVTLLSNFLSTLTISNIITKRFLLQTGGKHYAVHLGPTAIPLKEEGRVPHENFYFPQEDLLYSWAAKHNTHWTVTRPGFIIGANEGAVMNITYALALYAAIQKELGQKLEFPAGLEAWDALKDNTRASLIGYFSEWAVLTEGAADQALKIVDDSPFSYGAFWPELAAWYGIEAAKPEADESKYAVTTMPREPAPRGFGPAGKVYVAWSFLERAKRTEVKEAWEKIQAREGLKRELDPWRSCSTLAEVWGTLDAEVLGGWGRVMAKSLKWMGFVQTDVGIRETVELMVGMKMLPKLSV